MLHEHEHEQDKVHGSRGSWTSVCVPVGLDTGMDEEDKE